MTSLTLMLKGCNDQSERKLHQSIHQSVGMLQFLYNLLLTHLNYAPTLPFTFEEKPNEEDILYSLIQFFLFKWYPFR